MKIGGIGYIPKNIKWIVECIEKNFSQTQNFIEIWGDGNEIIFFVSPAKMRFEFEIFIEKKMVSISSILPGKEIFHTGGKQYPLTKKGLKKGLKETIERMKMEVARYLDSILKVKK